ncbi:MAG TPA: hypothetical protein VNY73_05355 [Bacteroidia bacterium]|jgi:hypothetical protein|nr:hypothetical protein [Bacteroidia bacterium]
MVFVINKKTSKKDLDRLFAGSRKKKGGFNAKKFCGSILYKKSPLLIQEQLRNEWA